MTLGVTVFTSASLADDQTKTATPSPTAVPAFPGAEGYGAKTIGRRGGKVLAQTLELLAQPVAVGSTELRHRW